MKDMRKAGALGGALLILTAGIAVAQGPAPTPGPGGMRPGMGQGMGPGGPGGPGMQGGGMMRMMDKDGDGAISRDEFAEAPRGGPGSMTDVAKEHRAERFRLMDRNGDGRITPDEMPGMAGSSGQSQ